MSNHSKQIGYNDIKQSKEIIIFVRFLQEPIVGIYDEQVKEKPSKKEIENLKSFKKDTAKIRFAGIRNEGATCYLNSLLQTYFILGAFTRNLFQIDTRGQNTQKSIPNALQRLFFTLQSQQLGTTMPLLRSFGWGNEEIHQQNDVQQFNTVLLDALDRKAKKSKSKVNFRNLFQGKSRTVIECTKVDFTSQNQNVFLDLQLNVKGSKNLIQSIKSQLKKEMLVGQNQYEAGQYGKQDARKYNQFLSLPPILQIQLMRFEYDPQTNGLKKIHDEFKFQQKLDLNCFVRQSDDQQQIDYTYQLHSILMHRGSTQGGHYYAYIKPNPSSHPIEQDNQWLKFNDQHVTRTKKKQAFNEAYGGSKLVLQAIDGKLVQVEKHPNVSAYMLVYLRKSRQENLLDRPLHEEIPQHLLEQFQQQKRLQ